VILTYLLLFQILAALMPAHLKEISPGQPFFNIIAPTWVIADLDIGLDGRGHFPRILTGGEPLRSSALSRVSGWIFEPARTTIPVESHVTAVFLFRPREIFSALQPDLSAISAEGSDTPPIPISLSDPGYPPTCIAEGEIVLEFLLSETGSIQTTRVVNGIPGLTKFTEEAVRNWKFRPAMRSGQPVPGTVIALISYLRPAVS
jgi:Gram-negative bacterial TonB protein C-terminal